MNFLVIFKIHTVLQTISCQADTVMWEKLVGHSILIEHQLSFDVNFSNGLFTHNFQYNQPCYCSKSFSHNSHLWYNYGEPTIWVQSFQIESRSAYGDHEKGNLVFYCVNKCRKNTHIRTPNEQRESVRGKKIKPELMKIQKPNLNCSNGIFKAYFILK